MGVHGRIYDENFEPVVGAEVYISECNERKCPVKNPYSTLSNSHGIYFKVFWPLNESNISTRHSKLTIMVRALNFIIIL